MPITLIRRRGISFLFLFSIISGIASAQIISFFQILKSTNYFLESNPHLASIVDNTILTAFSGAVFLSLTAGTAVSVISAISLSIIIFINYLKNYTTKLLTAEFSVFSISAYFVKTYHLYFLLWVMINIAITALGEDIFTAAYNIVIPSVILFNYTFFSLTKREISINSRIFIIFIITLSITLILYYFKCDKTLFIRFRDYILIPTEIGNLINNFYYKYNLYAVQAINKSNHQVIKLLCLSGLTIFLPLFIYAILFFLNFVFINFILKIIIERLTNISTINPSTFLSALCSGIICIAISVYIIHYLYPLSNLFSFSLNNKDTLMETMIDNPQTMLDGPDQRIRVEGLRVICQISNKNGTNINIWSYPEIINFMMNGTSVEKYWLANNFGAAKDFKAVSYLEKLIDDSSINVQSAAVKAFENLYISDLDKDLGSDLKIDKKKYILKIVENKIVNSDEWYVNQKAADVLKNIKNR